MDEYNQTVVTNDPDKVIEVAQNRHNAYGRSADGVAGYKVPIGEKAVIVRYDPEDEVTVHGADQEAIDQFGEIVYDDEENWDFT